MTYILLFAGQHSGSAAGCSEHEPGLQEPRTAAVDCRSAAAAPPATRPQPLPGLPLNAILFLIQPILGLLFNSILVPILIQPIPAQLTTVPAASQSWSHWRAGTN